MFKILDLFLVALCVLALIFVRAFEDVLFYDPYLEFFKRDYLYKEIPENINILKTILNVSLRYFINAVFSIVIIYILYKKRSIIKFTIVFYVFVFVILMSLFASLLNTGIDGVDNHVLFNIRRFLMQPIFLLVLLPAFYFSEKVSVK